MILLDSNVLIYATDRQSPHHDACVSFRDRAIRGEIAACLSPTVLTEFFAVVTDSRRAVNPLSSSEALDEIAVYHRTFPLLVPGDAALDRLQTLIERYDIQGQDVFDAFILATMLSHDVRRICTFNRSDFERFREVEVETPALSN